ncbi:hypothetical protein GCM10027411_03190 [Microbacterium aureliae]
MTLASTGKGGVDEGHDAALQRVGRDRLGLAVGGDVHEKRGRLEGRDCPDFLPGIGAGGWRTGAGLAVGAGARPRGGPGVGGGRGARSQGRPVGLVTATCSRRPFRRVSHSRY